jgi:uncharacterized protein
MSFEIESIDFNSGIETNRAIGVKFPFNGPAVFVSSFTTFDQAKTNLLSLLLTRRGERIMQPNFGTGIVDSLFEPTTPETAQFLTDDITSAVAYWLPYLIIDRLDIRTAYDDPELNHNIEISLSVTVTNIGANIEITLFANENGILEIQEGNGN